MERKCVIDGCDKPRSARGMTCGPDHAYVLRYGNLVGVGDVNSSRVVAKEETISIEEEHRLKKQLSYLRKQLSDILETRNNRSDYEDFVSIVTDAYRGTKDDSWRKPAAKSLKKSVMVASLSDIHAEETVDPEVMNWVNGYDLKIAERRVRNFFENLLTLSFDNLRGIEFGGLVLNLLGDMTSGWLHDLSETNGTAPQEACILVARWLKQGIALVSDHFGHVTIPCVIGNHGRMPTQKKMPFKNPVISSFDWLIYMMVADSFKSNPAVEFVIPKSIDVFYDIFGFRCAAEHGNRFKGGSNAISGIYPSISLGNYRKRNAEQSVGNPFSYLFLGDKHQLKFLGSVMLNGSVVGYNEMARDMKFAYEKPQQLFTVFDPEHGSTIKGEIFVASKDEPWIKHKK